MNTKTLHTCGPWQLSNGTDSIDLMGNNGQTLIASFPIPAKEEGVAYIPGEEDAANLRLIAASSQLLAAVSGILACIDRPGGTIGSITPESIMAARDAYAAATGGNQ